MKKFKYADFNIEFKWSYWSWEIFKYVYVYIFCKGILKN